MKFGRVEHPESIHFELPNTPTSTLAHLNSLEDSRPPRLYIGATGWSMKEWLGKTYPLGTKTSAFLKYYGEQFNTIELNTTHYRIPTLEIVEKWYEQTPKDFRFCPKVPQRISHSRDLGIENNLIDHFTENISYLKDKLGPCFVQFPPYFDYERYASLEVFLRNWPKGMPLAVEVRHPSWFDNLEHFQALYDLLKLYKVGIVITDVAGRRDVLHMGVSSHFAMLRWVGNGLIESDYTRIDDWVATIKDWYSKGLKEMYIFPHEPDNILAPDIAAYFYEQVKQALPQVQTRGPQIPYQGKGSQLGLF